MDLTAQLQQQGLMDENGNLESGQENPKTFLLVPPKESGNERGVYLTQKDIREIQLAKAAIAAGIRILMKTLSVTEEEISCLYIAGAFGNYIDPISAGIVGLIPRSLVSRIKPIGNAAGEGARIALLNKDERNMADKLAKSVQFVELAKGQGFSQATPLDCHTIELKPEVRQMCEANNCRMYDKCWSCPPGCGTLDECREKVVHYQQGILVQTTGLLEDDFDGEAMMETEALHKKHFYEFEKILRELYPGMLPIGAGCCTRCQKCTYPDEPCRFPKEAFSSMEAYGIVVARLCQANGLAYYYGPCTITYTSCYLLE
ncbi:DUF2284 domain-containing protein [Candidatus Merdisoma sp. JLR.KK006]|uniref:DUF2284 domain-containing protein n=1 Tax=Candidatus Merdisoma sp. JLR.KK006 TaxID=3112626 RepID=UPI002FF1146F